MDGGPSVSRHCSVRADVCKYSEVQGHVLLQKGQFCDGFRNWLSCGASCQMELVSGAVSLGQSKALSSSVLGLAAQPGLWRVLGWTDACLI